MHHLLMVFMLAYWFTRHCRCTRSRHAHDCSKTTPVLLSRWPSWITALANVRYRHYLCFPKAITNRPPTHTATSIIFLLVPSYRFFFSTALPLFISPFLPISLASLPVFLPCLLPPMLLSSFSLFPRFHHAKITTTPIKCQWDSTAPWTEFMDLSCVMHCTPRRWAAYPLRGLIIFISRNYPHLFRAAPQIDLHVRMEILNSFFPSVKGR